jgi:hypothetical protein
MTVDPFLDIFTDFFGLPLVDDGRLVFYYTPPTVKLWYRFPHDGALPTGMRYSIPQGLTVYRLDGTWHVGQSFSEDLLNMADRVYLGGHIYSLTHTLYQELVDSGVGGTFDPIAEDSFDDSFEDVF